MKSFSSVAYGNGIKTITQYIVYVDISDKYIPLKLKRNIQQYIVAAYCW